MSAGVTSYTYPLTLDPPQIRKKMFDPWKNFQKPLFCMGKDKNGKSVGKWRCRWDARGRKGTWSFWMFLGPWLGLGGETVGPTGGYPGMGRLPGDETRPGMGGGGWTLAGMEAKDVGLEGARPAGDGYWPRTCDILIPELC